MADQPKRQPKAAKRGGSPRKDGYRGGTGADVKDLPPDFVGLIGKDGKVLVDDTSYFRIQAEEAPIVEYLRANPYVQEKRQELREAMHSLEEIDEELRRRIGIRQLWLEQALVTAFSFMLREAKEGKR